MKELSLHLLDLIENAVAAGATRVRALISERPDRDRLYLSVSDDGRGMSADLARRALDPFTTTRRSRKVGLGLALLASTAAQAGGRAAVHSAPGRGTTVRVSMGLSHLDRPPLGRLDETLAVCAVLHPQLDLRLRHRTPYGSYEINTLQLPRDLGPKGIRAQLAARVSAGLARIRSQA
jgi:hypothetical protein